MCSHANLIMWLKAIVYGSSEQHWEYFTRNGWVIVIKY